VRSIVFSVVFFAMGCFNPYARTGWEFRVHRPSTQVGGEVLSTSGNSWIRERIAPPAPFAESAPVSYAAPAPVLGVSQCAATTSRSITREGLLLEEILLRLGALECALRQPARSTQAAPVPRKCD